jgi:hypothetical protein
LLKAIYRKKLNDKTVPLTNRGTKNGNKMEVIEEIKAEGKNKKKATKKIIIPK